MRQRRRSIRGDAVPHGHFTNKATTAIDNKVTIWLQIHDALLQKSQIMP